MTRLTCEDTAIVRNRNLHNQYYSLTFEPYSRVSECSPGRFVHLKLPGSQMYFRRAMSVASIDRRRKSLEIIFKVFGRGTTILAGYEKGTRVNILGPLGKSFSLPRKNERVLIVGGGIGLPPVLYLATELVAGGFSPKQIEFFYGGRSSHDILERGRIKRLGIRFHPVTDDGSFGDKGFVTESLSRFIESHGKENMRLYGCGPEAMLKAVDEIGIRHNIPGQLSHEAPMPCGIGVCLGCIVPLRSGGYARVCADGPVFDIGEVLL